MTIIIDAPSVLSERIASAAKREGMTVEKYTLRLLWKSSGLAEPEQGSERERLKQETLAAILAGKYATPNPDASSEAFIARKSLN